MTTSPTTCEFAAGGTRCGRPATKFEDRLLCDPHRAQVEAQRRRLLALHDTAGRRPLTAADMHAVLVDLERDLARIQRGRL